MKYYVNDFIAPTSKKSRYPYIYSRIHIFSIFQLIIARISHKRLADILSSFSQPLLSLSFARTFLSPSFSSNRPWLSSLSLFLSILRPLYSAALLVDHNLHPNDILSEFPQKYRNMISRSFRQGYISLLRKVSTDDIFFDRYIDFCQRKGFSPVNLSSLSLNEYRDNFFIIDIIGNQQVLSSALFCEEPHSIIYFCSYSSPVRAPGASNRLIYEAYLYALTNSFEFVDLGGIDSLTSSHPIDKFKLSSGAIPYLRSIITPSFKFNCARPST